MKASLNNYRQAPRKVRLVGDLLRGKKVDDALITLQFLTKRAALPWRKLLASAVANAPAAGREQLVIKEVRVDGGVTLKRMRPRARGSGARINKRTSHLSIQLV